MTDILDDIFRMIELSACVYFQEDFSPPWAMEVDVPKVSRFHYLISGAVLLDRGEEVVTLEAGDLLHFPGGARHIVADRAGRQSVPGRRVVEAITA